MKNGKTSTTQWVKRLNLFSMNQNRIKYINNVTITLNHNKKK